MGYKLCKLQHMQVQHQFYSLVQTKRWGLHYLFGKVKYFSIQQHILATFFHKQLNLTLLTHTHTHLYLHACTHTHTHTHTHFQEAHTLVICIIIGLEVHRFWLLYGSLLSLFQSCACWCQSILGYVYLWNEIGINWSHSHAKMSEHANTGMVMDGTTAGQLHLPWWANHACSNWPQTQVCKYYPYLYLQ